MKLLIAVIATLAILSFVSCDEMLTSYVYVKETKDSYDHPTVMFRSDYEYFGNVSVCCGRGFCSHQYYSTSEMIRNSSICCNVNYTTGCKCDSYTPKDYICGVKNCTCTACFNLKYTTYLMKYTGIQCSLRAQRVLKYSYLSRVPGIKLPYRESSNLLSGLKSTRYYPDLTVYFKEGNVDIQTLNGSINWLRLGGSAGSKEYTDLSGSIRLENVCERSMKSGFITIEYEQNSIHYGPDVLENTPYDECEHISNCWYCLKRYSCEQGFTAFIIAIIWISIIALAVLALIVLILLTYKFSNKFISKCWCVNLSDCCNISYKKWFSKKKHNKLTEMDELTDSEKSQFPEDVDDFAQYTDDKMKNMENVSSVDLINMEKNKNKDSRKWNEMYAQSVSPQSGKRLQELRSAADGGDSSTKNLYKMIQNNEIGKFGPYPDDTSKAFRVLVSEYMSNTHSSEIPFVEDLEIKAKSLKKFETGSVSITTQCKSFNAMSSTKKADFCCWLFNRWVLHDLPDIFIEDADNMKIKYDEMKSVSDETVVKVFKKKTGKMWFTLFILGLFLSVVGASTTCSDVFGIAGKTEFCSSNGTVETCYMQTTATLTLPGVGSTACMQLRREDGSSIMRMIVNVKDYFQSAKYTPLYYTDNYLIQRISTTDGGSSGSVDYCNFDICNTVHQCNVWGWSDRQHPWLNMICSPGKAACFMCGYSSVYYAQWILPGSMGLMHDLVTNVFNPVYQITIEDSTGTREITKQLYVGEHYDLNGIRLSRGVETTPQILDLSSYKLLTWKNRAYLCIASDVTKNIIGTMGDVQRTSPEQDSQCLQYNGNLHNDGTPYTKITTLPADWPQDRIQDCTVTYQVTRSGWDISFAQSCKDITEPIIINGFSVVADRDINNQTVVIARSPYLVNINLNIETTIESQFDIQIQDNTLIELETSCSGSSGVFGSTSLTYKCKCKYFEECQVIAHDDNQESLGFLTCNGKTNVMTLLSTSDKLDFTLYASNMRSRVACETPLAFVLPNTTWTGFTVSGEGSGSSNFGNLFGFLDYFDSLSTLGKVGLSALFSIINIAILIGVIFIIYKIITLCLSRRKQNSSDANIRLINTTENK